MGGNQQRGIQMREKMLNYIISYIQMHGYSPSLREIQTSVGLKSLSSVYSHLVRMMDEGEIQTDAKRGTARAIRVPGYKFVKIEDEKWD